MELFVRRFRRENCSVDILVALEDAPRTLARIETLHTDAHADASLAANAKRTVKDVTGAAESSLGEGATEQVGAPIGNASEDSALLSMRKIGAKLRCCHIPDVCVGSDVFHGSMLHNSKEQRGNTQSR